MEVTRIIKGFSNLVLDSLGMLDNKTKSLAQSRINICKGCPLRSGDWCDKKKTIEHHKGMVSGCGCYLEAATLVQDKKCPRGLW